MPRLSSRPLKRFCYAFVPTLFRTHYFNEVPPKPLLRPTAYLDGARGYAALAVLNYHFFYAYSDMAQVPWNFRNPLLMPILRLWLSGGSAIPLFFTFGGYAISLKPLRLMSAVGEKKSQHLFDTLSSSAFRRFFRLYLPIFVMTFLVAICVHLGVYEPMRSRLRSQGSLSDMARFHERHLKRSGSLELQILQWLDDMLRTTGAWDWKDYGPDHDKHLWTILSEFRCSVAVYFTLLATASLRPWIRLSTILLLSLHSYYFFRTDMFNYYWGVILAQLDVILTSSPVQDVVHEDHSFSSITELEKGYHPTAILSKTSVFGEIGLSILFVFSLWCLSAPSWGWDTAIGYRALARFVPRHGAKRDMFIPAVGVILLQRCLSHSSPDSLRIALFTNSVALYLAKISFSLYIVHGPILHAFGYNIPSLFCSLAGKQSSLEYGFGHVVGWLISLTLCLWAADLFHREVELRCITFTGWIESKCILR